MVKGRGVTDKVISTMQLKLLIDFSKEEVGMIVYLRRLGYVKYPKRINYEDTFHHVWYRGISSTKVNKQFRESMNKEFQNG